jgi:2-oxo-hept-3-ene-1,7-dioate hydratase
MSLTKKTIEDSATRLEEAARSLVPCRQLLLEYPAMTIEDSYAIQRAWMAAKVRGGAVVKGHKIGLTSKAMQQAVNISEPDYGVLLDEMFFRDGGVVPTKRFLQLRIEAELAFVLARPLEGPTCTLYDVLEATAYVTPALEILDARTHRVDPETKRTRSVLDTIADNAANAGVVLGGRPFKPGSLEIDMRRIGVAVSRNGDVEETGLAAGVLNHPALGVAWLANRLHAHGERLEAGEIVLAGSFIRPIPVNAGDTISADYGAFGSVACHFA